MPRNFSPWAQWMAQLDCVAHEDPFPDEIGDLGSWRTRRRERLLELLGERPPPVPLALEVLSVDACPGYRREKLVFDAEEHMSVPAYLLVPDGRVEPGPAVLAIHGHGPGKDHVCGLAATNDPGGAYAVQLVQRGFVVLAPDLRCFGERLDTNPPGHYACDTNLVHAYMAGISPLSQNLWDLVRCVDVLVQHELVDGSRVGVAGLSYGGTMSLFLAAYDQRIAAAVVSGYFSSLEASHRVPMNMCGSQVLPGMLGRMDHIDVAAQVAPRPLLVESGVDDPIFPVEAATASMQRLQRVYEQFDAADRLHHDIFAGGHRWHGTAAVPFLADALGLSAASA